MRLAIVIPTLDEENGLRHCLPQALAVGDEVCVSDGGSRDATVALARSLGARVVVGPPGRGIQLNRGARATDAEILLFLHADTRLPDGCAELVRRTIERGFCGGGFLLRFDAEPGFLRPARWLINARTRLTRCPLGDQAHFVRRDVFETLGGYREWPLLEDLDFIRRLKRGGPTVILPAAVVTSSRGYLARGVLRAYLTNGLIFGLYFLGVPPDRLVRLYRNVR